MVTWLSEDLPIDPQKGDNYVLFPTIPSETMKNSLSGQEIKHFFSCLEFHFVKDSVTVTDLFPLANQCPCQAIQPLTDQSGTERIDFFFLSRTIFFVFFWKSRQVREHLVSSQGILCYGHSTWNTFTEEYTATSFTHRRTSLVASHTSYLLQWHTLPTNSRTNILSVDTKKNLFSIWLVYFCFYKKTFRFQRSLVIYLYCQLIYSVMETNH